ncbi:MAG: thioredoxin family protein [Candidatus Aenigmarchaeota archaeon]|nr:thioredoxin family protein [Candidatus Aenigmarchaeota archaeon]
MKYAFILLLVFSVLCVSATETGEVKLESRGVAPEIHSVQWLSSEPLTMEGLRGKVVLVDFWTYSCINCIRTLPYLKEWNAKYADKGLVIIGMHTPEFDFEKSEDNVRAAVEKFGIKYAVAMDNNYVMWRAYGNSYWPRKYLIDREGNIAYDHIGEGGYEETEAVIQKLLGVKTEMVNVSKELRNIGTPELYLGYNFARQSLGNEEGFRPDEVVAYERTEIARPNFVYLEGMWKNDPDSMEALSDAKLSLIYLASDVNIVAAGLGRAEILVDGNPVKDAGSDIVEENGRTYIEISEERLYSLVSSPLSGVHLIEIIPDGEFRIYTFTFG